MNLYVDVPPAPTFPRLLSLAQKVGAGRYAYPRPDGVLVPRPLRDIGGRQSPITQDRLQRGRMVILDVARSMRHLPAELLDLVLPHPSVVLRDLPIEDRTRSVLDRFLPTIAKEPVWTVGRYLGIPKFGARCLVDLLSACEEVARGDDEVGPRSASVGDAVRAVPGTLRRIERAAPSRIINCGGNQIAVAGAHRGLAATVIAT